MAVASRFLPPDFAPSQTVVVIAGKGRYPALLVECARARGAKIKLVSFEEETDPALIAAFDPADHRAIPVGKLEIFDLRHGVHGVDERHIPALGRQPAHLT